MVRLPTGGKNNLDIESGSQMEITFIQYVKLVQNVLIASRGQGNRMGKMTENVGNA